MRTIQAIRTALLLVAATVFTAPLMAQDWVPEKGYWEVITQETHLRRATVRFYDLESHLLYEEKVQGMRIDLRNRKTCLRLNKILLTALAAWKENRPMRKDEGIVAMNRKNR